MGQTTDVAIIGGGVAGCAAAYYMTREGLDVAVIDHRGIGNAASGYALGLLNPLSGAAIPGPLAAFASEAFAEHRRLWPQLEEESSIDFQGRMMPHLEVVLDEIDVSPLRDEMGRWNATDGFSARWLDCEEVRALDSRIADEVVGAVLLESLGMVDSRLLTRALMDAACQRGASIVEERALGISWSGDRAVCVSTIGGEIACRAVVIRDRPLVGSGWGVDRSRYSRHAAQGTDRPARRVEPSAAVPYRWSRRSGAEGGRQALGRGDGRGGRLRSHDHLRGEAEPP